MIWWLFACVLSFVTGTTVGLIVGGFVRVAREIDQ